jgi:predicted glutamine amidotransferase
MLSAGKGCRCYTDILPASESPIALVMANHSIKTQNVMSHVRFATAGAVQLENVHPFVREWGGRMWSFCHNGVCNTLYTMHYNIHNIPAF